MSSRMIFNERVRLGAMSFNNLGIIAMSTGVIAPVYESYVDNDPFEVHMSSFVVLGLGLVLICIAQGLLSLLRE